MPEPTNKRIIGVVSIAFAALALIVGLVLACVQSYLYSVGNIGTVTVWVCAFLAGAVASRRAAA